MWLSVKSGSIWLGKLFQQLDNSTTIFLSALCSRGKLCAYNQTQKSYKPCFLCFENLICKSFFVQIKIEHAKLLYCVQLIVGDHLQVCACIWIIVIAWRVQLKAPKGRETHSSAALLHPGEVLSVFHRLGIYSPLLGYLVEVNTHIKIEM